MFYKKKNKSGIVTLIYILIIALIASFVLVIGNSRLLLAIQAGRSISDNLLASYQAETEITNIVNNLVKGTWDVQDIKNIPHNRALGDAQLVTSVTDDPQAGQVVSITTKRDFSVQKIQAGIGTSNSSDKIEIVLALDCTDSMGFAGSNNGSYQPTRFDELEYATLNFFDNLENLEKVRPEFAGKLSVGIVVFGLDAKWVQFRGTDLTPQVNASCDDLRSIIENGINTWRDQSPICQTVMDATSVGSGFAKANEYFSNHKKAGVAGVEVLITDGVPNSRVPDQHCPPVNSFCPAVFVEPATGRNYCDNNQYNWNCDNYNLYRNDNQPTGYNPTAYNYCYPKGLDFLRCSLADSNTNVSEIGQKGIRDPNVRAYAVTVFPNVTGEVQEAFSKYATAYLHSDQASELTTHFNTNFQDIVHNVAKINITRVIPQPE